MGQTPRKLDMNIETWASGEECVRDGRRHEMPIRRVHCPAIVEQVEGMLDPRSPLVDFGLNLGSLLPVSDPVLYEIPKLAGERISGAVQV